MKLQFFSLWKLAKFLMSFLKVKVCFPWNFASIFSLIKHNSSVLLVAQTLYTLVKKSSLKWKFLRLLSAGVKTCQICHVSFETTSQFPSKFCVTLQCDERKLLCTFLVQTIYTLLKKDPIKAKVFETFECLGQNMLDWSCQFWSEKSIQSKSFRFLWL